MSNYNLNKVTLIGNIGNTPKVYEKTPERSAFAIAQLATNQYWKHEGETKSKTTWHDLLFPEHLVDLVSNHIQKGEKLYVEGELANRRVELPSGEHYIATRVQVKHIGFLSNKSAESYIEPEESIAQKSISTAKKALENVA